MTFCCYYTPWRWHTGVETCRSWHLIWSVCYHLCFIVLRLEHFVRECIECKKAHGMNNTKCSDHCLIMIRNTMNSWILHELRIKRPILCLWFRASLTFINNCPTRRNTKQSIYSSASSLYMFRVSTTPIIRSTQTVTTASGTGHIIYAVTSLQRGQDKKK